MAFYVRIEKRSETAELAVYEYWSKEESRGSLQLSKSSGEVSPLRGTSGDERGDLFMRAAMKLRREWKEGRVPEVVEWAS
jgi:hypothetical protein